MQDYDEKRGGSERQRPCSNLAVGELQSSYSSELPGTLQVPAS